MTFYVVEGIDYSGKSMASDILRTRFNCEYNILSVEKKNQVHDLPPEARFNGFLKFNTELYAEALNAHSKEANVVVERLWPSTIAYHNLLLGKRLEENKNVRSCIEMMKPDRFVFITTNMATLKKRMESCPPAHKYEDDATFLMSAQNELRRILQFAYKNMNIQFTEIDNSEDDVKKLEKKLLNFHF